MRILSKKMIKDFGETNAQAKEELAIWYAQMEAADWKDFNALRADYPSCDYLGNDRFCFNIKGNHYRVIVMLFFSTRRMYIRGIFSHADYSKLTKSKVLAL